MVKGNRYATCWDKSMGFLRNRSFMKDWARLRYLLGAAITTSSAAQAIEFAPHIENIRGLGHNGHRLNYQLRGIGR
jgi:hypothetical protein